MTAGEVSEQDPAVSREHLLRQVANLQEALATREVIGQAKGVIMATMSCSAEQAFDVLRQQSQHENRKLRDVARDVVAQAASRRSPVRVAAGSGRDPDLARTEQVARLSRLQSFAHALTTVLDADDLLEIVMRQGIAGADADGWAVAVVEGRTVRPVVIVGYSQESVDAFPAMTVDAELPLTVAARVNSGVFVSSRAEAAERFPTLMRVPTASHAWAALPLTSGGLTIGVLGISFEAPHSFDEDERLFLATLADLIAASMRPPLLSKLRSEHGVAFNAHVARSNPSVARRVSAPPRRSEQSSSADHDIGKPDGQHDSEQVPVPGERSEGSGAARDE